MIQFLIIIVLPVLGAYLLFKLNTKKIDYLFTEIANMLMITYVIFFIYLVWFSSSHIVLPGLHMNLLPFNTVYQYLLEAANGIVPISVVAVNLFGNILLTLPIGIWLGFNGYSHKKTLTIAIFIPILIESIQLILQLIEYSTRSVDIDDFILNFIGIMVGFFIARKFLPAKKSRFLQSGERNEKVRSS
ncbi:VanZ family protein [Virgibacillus sp. YIM 98842]|uniref:VanZ family protein n=1 Tax=Virgibacillus sp. YIM 98842 TaxID=2663533 RepID=UPI0013D9EB70|nr:VanZ family protein [Virgibacillus sp. YIM 98842]